MVLLGIRFSLNMGQAEHVMFYTRRYSSNLQCCVGEWVHMVVTITLSSLIETV